MKKISLLAVSLFVGFMASAQADLVKDVERQLKASKPDYQKALNDIKPALTNPETAGEEMPWYLAAQANSGIFDQVYIMETTGTPTSREAKLAAGHAMIDAINDYFKAIENGQKLNEKGKPVGKKTKDCLKKIAGSYDYLRTAGVFLFDNQDYPGAVEVWDMYVNLPSDPRLGKEAPTAHPDDVVDQIAYYEGLAALIADDNTKAYEVFSKLHDKGTYDTLDFYKFLVESARRVNSDKLTQYAEEGFAKYGAEDQVFIVTIINPKLDANDYDGARVSTEKALEAVPDSNFVMRANLYNILGYIAEAQNNPVDAEKFYGLSYKTDPNTAKNVFDYARTIFNRGVALDQKYADQGQESAPDSEIAPIYLEAAPLLEKALNMDEETYESKIPYILYRLYYRLGKDYLDQCNYWKSLVPGE